MKHQHSILVIITSVTILLSIVIFQLLTEVIPQVVHCFSKGFFIKYASLVTSGLNHADLHSPRAQLTPDAIGQGFYAIFGYTVS